MIYNIGPQIRLISMKLMCFAVAAWLVLLLSCGKSVKNDANRDPAGSPDKTSSNGLHSSENFANSNHPKRVVSADVTRRQVLDAFVVKWQELLRKGKDMDLEAKRKELALGAVKELGGCPELMQLLDFLTTSGAGTLRNELIASDLSGIFVGPGANDSREWLLTIVDKKLKEQLLRQAGEVFTGLGFKEYFEQTGAVAGLNCQASLLTGYCVTMARTDPEGAVRVYKDLAYPKHIDNSGMADIMSALPADSDFLKFAKDIKEDSMTLARRARTALLRNWSSVKPLDAAQYVLDNRPPMVNPEQMGVVAETWAAKSPDAAAEWLIKASEGKSRDEGVAALAKFWCGKDITKAWQFAVQVGDLQKRIDTATVVFKEWEKSDKTAATAAWVAMFPH